MDRLDYAFFHRPCLEVARDLVGKVLVHNGQQLRISETEAYCGESDTACHAHKSKHSAIIGLILGTASMSILGSAFNAVYLLPKFSQLFGLPLDSIIAMGTKINGSVHNVTTFVMLCVAPLNLVKGTVVSVLTMLLYKRVAKPLFGLHK